MRKIMIVAAVLAVSACNRGTANNGAGNASANAAAPTNNAAAPANAAAANSAAPATTTASATLPPNFPGDNLLERGAECIAYIGLARQAGATPAGRDGPIMEQSAGQWEAALKASDTPEMEWKQLLASSVAVLDDVPAAQRDAAVNWCVENAPDPA